MQTATRGVEPIPVLPSIANKKESLMLIQTPKN